MTGAAGLVFDLKRFAVHDGPGIRTTVFLKGCSLSCQWCHSPESQSPLPEVMYSAAVCIGCGACAAACPRGLLAGGPGQLDRSECAGCGACVAACNSGALAMVGTVARAQEVVVRLDRDWMLYAASGGGITLSGGEPALQPQFAAAILRDARAHGYHTALETSGNVPWGALSTVLEHTDLVLFDVKHASGDEHLALTGVRNEQILDNLRRVSEMAAASGADTGAAGLIVRVPVVPGFNDQPDHICVLAALLGGLPRVDRVELLPYHNLGAPKYAALGRTYTLGSVPSPSAASLKRIAAILMDRGLDVIIEGAGLDDPS